MNRSIYHTLFVHILNRISSIFCFFPTIDIFRRTFLAEFIKYFPFATITYSTSAMVQSWKWSEWTQLSSKWYYRRSGAPAKNMYALRWFEWNLSTINCIENLLCLNYSNAFARPKNDKGQSRLLNGHYLRSRTQIRVDDWFERTKGNEVLSTIIWSSFSLFWWLNWPYLVNEVALSAGIRFLLHFVFQWYSLFFCKNTAFSSFNAIHKSHRHLVRNVAICQLKSQFLGNFSCRNGIRAVRRVFGIIQI